MMVVVFLVVFYGNLNLRINVIYVIIFVRDVKEVVLFIVFFVK